MGNKHYVIIHADDLENILQDENSGWEAWRIRKVLRRINQVRGYALEIDSPIHPRTVADYFQQGDEVVLYGCWRGCCLDKAYRALKNKRVTVTIDREGSI